MVYSTYLMLDPKGAWARKTHVHRGDIILDHERYDEAFTVEKNYGPSETTDALIWRFLDADGNERRLAGSYLIYWPFPFCEVHRSYRPCEHNGAIFKHKIWQWPVLSTMGTVLC